VDFLEWGVGKPQWYCAVMVEAAEAEAKAHRQHNPHPYNMSIKWFAP
jgi:hypothetical protein